MNKQTKNIITHEYITEELRFQNSAAIRFALVLCGGFALVFLPLTAGIIYGIFKYIDRLPLEIILSAIIGGITSAPVWCMIFSLRQALTEKKMLDRGEFEIVTRDVLYKEEKIVNRHEEKFLCFGDFESVQVNQTVYDLASQGDEFYIVHYKNKPRVCLLYSFKTHELKTEENGYGKGQDHT